ncbi:hypothetical protein vseg_011691 [Gypsophila vaccaria]
MIKDKLRDDYVGNFCHTKVGVYTIAEGYEWMARTDMKKDWADFVWNRNHMRIFIFNPSIVRNAFLEWKGSVLDA